MASPRSSAPPASPRASAPPAAPRSSAPPDPIPAPTLAALLHRQAGVVSRAQALAAGVDARDVDRHLARRRWRPVHPRVYLVGGHPLTDEARVRAAVLWAGDGAVVVGAAAAWWHGLAGRAPATVTLAVRSRCPAGRPGVAVRRRVLPPPDVVTVRGLAVPVRPLALLDAAVEAGAAGTALLHAGAPRVGLAQLREVAARSAGPTTAARLLAGVIDVIPAPAVHRGEWSCHRNRYS